MHKDSVAYKILIISMIFFIGLSIIFMALIPIGTSYLYGWIFSSGISLIGYLFGLWIIKITINSKGKKFARTLNYIRIFILYILHILSIILLIWIDKKNNGLKLWGTRGMDSLYEPINIFTYLGAVAVIPISTLIAHIPSKKGN